jgi:enoyl-CoA hydratase/carnithine racemase
MGPSVDFGLGGSRSGPAPRTTANFIEENLMDRDSDVLLVDRNQKGVARLTLNRPDRLNALSLELKAQLMSAIREADADPEIRVIVLAGSGRAFCAGADLTDLSPTENFEYRRELRALQDGLIRSLWTADTIVVAEVRGWAVGAGFSVVLASDLVVASDRAKFQAPFVTGPGLVADTGIAFLLPRVVGAMRAKELLLTGRTVESAEAHQLGLVSTLVPDDQLEARSRDLVSSLLACPRHALASSKSLVRLGLETGLDAVLEQEASYQAMLRLTEEHRAAVKRFAARGKN